MLVVQVDDVDAEATKRVVAGLQHVLGLAVHAHERAVLAALVAELGGEHDLASAVLDGAPHEQLVRERTVHVGGVEEVHPAVERLVDRGDRLVVVADPVELAHTHATQSLLGDFETLT